MTLVSVASRRGSPGATTFAALLAAAWPADRTRYLIEADPAGGVLAARWHEIAGLTVEPGLLELTSSRSSLDAELLRSHSQRLTPEVRLIPARAVPQQVEAALGNLGAEGAHSLSRLPDNPVVADLGRLSAGAPSLLLARASAITLLVFRPYLEEVQSVLLAVADLQAEGINVGLVAVGDRPYHPADVAERAEVDFFVQVPDDPKSSDMFFRNGFAWRGLKRSPLARATQSVADAVAALVPAAAGGVR